jgi:hypothetical protein
MLSMGDCSKLHPKFGPRKTPSTHEKNTIAERQISLENLPSPLSPVKRWQLGFTRIVKEVCHPKAVHAHPVLQPGIARSADRQRRLCFDRGEGTLPE